MLKLSKALALLTGLLLFSGNVAAELTSTVNRTEIGSGETIDLTVSYSGQTSSEPDFSPLNHQFEILNKSHQSQISVINGNLTANTTWQITLLPRSPGKALIPTFHFQGDTSNAIQLSVKGNDARDSSGDFDSEKPVFAKASLDKTTLYVQEQALLTIRLYTRVALSDYTASNVEVDGAKVIKVSEDRYRKQIDGYTYVVLETRYVLFPERSGELEVPALRFNASITDGNNRFGSFFDRRGKPIYLLSKPLSLDVKPAPSMDGSTQWLPAKRLRLQQDWSTEERDIIVGEPITRTLTIEADELTSAQLPPLDIKSSDDYRMYPDQALTEDIPSSGGITGKRVEALAIVPTHVGTLELPEIKLRWWDSRNKRFQDAIVPGKTFNILPAASTNLPGKYSDQASTTTPEITSHQPESSPPLNGRINLWLAAGNLIFLLTTLTFAFLWQRGAPASISPEVSKPDSSNALKAVANSAKTGDLSALREAIIHWAQIHWDTLEILTLQQVAARAKQQGKQEQLQDYFTWLDQQLYAGNNLAVDAKVSANEAAAAKAGDKKETYSLLELLAILKKMDKEPGNSQAVQEHSLQALYPQ